MLQLLLLPLLLLPLLDLLLLLELKCVRHCRQRSLLAAHHSALHRLAK
jgi:hypothetical protein